MQRRFHTHRPQGDTFPSELFEPFEPSESGPLRGPIVISTVAERSGEISLQNETSHTVTGDLSTQSLNRAKYLCPHIDMQLRSR